MKTGKLRLSKWIKRPMFVLLAGKPPFNCSSLTLFRDRSYLFFRSFELSINGLSTPRVVSFEGYVHNQTNIF